jgi:hypothetical protein
MLSCSKRFFRFFDGNATTETKPFDAWKQAWNKILRVFPEPVEEERKKSFFFSPFKEFITLFWFWLLQEILKFCPTFEWVAILGKYFFHQTYKILSVFGFSIFSKKFWIFERQTIVFVVQNFEIETLCETQVKTSGFAKYKWKKKVIVLYRKRKIDKVSKFVKLKSKECSKNQKYLNCVDMHISYVKAKKHKNK